jgi:hypothetical protein
MCLTPPATLPFIKASCADNPEHLKAHIAQSPEAFAVSLCAAMRVLCAAMCSRALTQAAVDTTTDAAASAEQHVAGSGDVLLSKLPIELIDDLPPEVLLSAVDRAILAATPAINTIAYKVDMSAAPGVGSNAAAGSSSSSSSSRHGIKLETQQHVPFAMSLLLTAQKCASALRSACPKLALDIAATVGR